jgi:hypothetical protein
MDYKPGTGFSFTGGVYIDKHAVQRAFIKRWSRVTRDGDEKTRDSMEMKMGIRRASNRELPETESTVDRMGLGSR